MQPRLSLLLTRCLWLCAALTLGLGLNGVAEGRQVTVALAANFAPLVKDLKPLFEEQSGHQLLVSVASTGTLYAQIQNGAPFDIFLAADNQRPQQLIADGLAVESSLFNYAIGRLVLWSSKPELIDAQGKILSEGQWAAMGIERIARANPRTAPYGVAAMETLSALGLTEATKNSLVTGQNVAQSFQFIISANAQAGFIALSQVLALPDGQRGSYWLIPAGLYRPIRQSAVLLKSGQDNSAAMAFLNFLQSPEATAIIQAKGYNVTHDSAVKVWSANKSGQELTK